MKKFIILFLLTAVNLHAQLTLEKCRQMAEDNYPLKKQIPLREEITRLKTDNIGAKYLPEFNIFASAQYQSDVTKIDLDMELPGGISPSFPEMPHDQYQAGISITQLIWDGGIISGKRELEFAKGATDVQSVRVELYSLKEKVNRAYFSILVIEENLKSLGLVKKTIEAKLNRARSGVENGVVLESSAQILEAELLNLAQKAEELEAAKASAMQTLGELTGQKIDGGKKLALPDYSEPLPLKDYSGRPEYVLFSKSKKNLEAAKDLQKSIYMPKISAFFQGFYGKPGLDMFSDEFRPFYVVGVQASWTVYNWGVTRRETQALEIQKNIIDTQKGAFTKNLSIAEKQYLNDIKKYEKMLGRDRDIISLRESILKKVSSQLDNGVITSTEYLTELNKKAKAELDLELHKIQKIYAETGYLTLTGNIENNK